MREKSRPEQRKRFSHRRSAISPRKSVGTSRRVAGSLVRFQSYIFLFLIYRRDTGSRIVCSSVPTFRSALRIRMCGSNGGLTLNFLSRPMSKTCRWYSRTIALGLRRNETHDSRRRPNKTRSADDIHRIPLRPDDSVPIMFTVL